MMRVRVKSRRYDSDRGCYVYDVSFKTKTTLTERTIKVAEAFGLGADEEREQILLRDFELKLVEGDIVYITGESGSGKSVLLHALRGDLGDRAADLSEVTVDETQPIIDTVGASFTEALALLSRVGLNDAYLFLRRYPELSDGQKYRYRIARMIDSGKKFWLADEFCSTLDRTTAKVVAYNIQKQAHHSGATLIVATSHTDLEEDLSPTTVIRKSWGDEVKIEYKKTRVAECTAIRGIAIAEGTKEDYRRLAYLHYRDSRLPVPMKIYAAHLGEELVGVIVYSYPPIRASGRHLAVLNHPNLDELNRDWAAISRVIVHPKYRTTGLGARLIRETLPLIGRCHVELTAVMAGYNPFAERAGMTLIHQSTPDPSVSDAIKALRTIGFDPTTLTSQAQNKRILESLSPEDLEEVRRILLGIKNVYYKRIGSTSSAYTRRPEMQTWLNKQGPPRLAVSLKALAVLSQSKAYLHWNNPQNITGDRPPQPQV
jgi:ABC-type lipoprotein export system ATPase subunit/GNAT superfamily N-acetyltransferase